MKVLSINKNSNGLRELIRKANRFDYLLLEEYGEPKAVVVPTSDTVIRNSKFVKELYGDYALWKKGKIKGVSLEAYLKKNKKPTRANK